MPDEPYGHHNTWSPLRKDYANDNYSETCATLALDCRVLGTQSTGDVMTALRKQQNKNVIQETNEDRNIKTCYNGGN